MWIKGNAKKKNITVFFSPELSCPSPAKFPEGKQVLAFLTYVPKVEGYKVESLSYGTRILEKRGQSVKKGISVLDSRLPGFQ